MKPPEKPPERTPERVNLQPGDVVFFQKCKRGSSKKSPEIGFKGHGFGVMLGILPTFTSDPKPEHLFALMGTIGYVTFDDVMEFLGPELGQKVVDAFTEKYSLPEEKAEAAAKASGLVDDSGKPLEMKEGSDEPTSH